MIPRNTSACGVLGNTFYSAKTGVYIPSKFILKMERWVTGLILNLKIMCARWFGNSC